MKLESQTKVWNIPPFYVNMDKKFKKFYNHGYN